MLFARPCVAERLPPLATPSHYLLHFEPDLDAERFTGRAQIRMTLPGRISTLVLNSAQPTYDTVTAEYQGAQQRASATADGDAQPRTRDP